MATKQKKSKGRKRGPKLRYGQVLIRTTFQCTSIMLERCDRIAEAEHRSRSDVMRRAIDQFLGRAEEEWGITA